MAEGEGYRTAFIVLEEMAQVVIMTVLSSLVKKIMLVYGTIQ